MPLITIKKGGPTNDVEDGVYPVVLTALSLPKTIYPQNAPEGTSIHEWEFAIDDGSGTGIQGTTSTASGPKSKMFGWITALLGGKPPAADQTFEAVDLVGKRALATIGHNEGGWPVISQLTAMPTAMLQQQFAQATGAPTRTPPKGRPSALNLAPAQPVAVEVAGDDLPF